MFKKQKSPFFRASAEFTERRREKNLRQSVSDDAKSQSEILYLPNSGICLGICTTGGSLIMSAQKIIWKTGGKHGTHCMVCIHRMIRTMQYDILGRIQCTHKSAFWGTLSGRIKIHLRKHKRFCGTHNVKFSRRKKRYLEDAQYTLFYLQRGAQS